MAQKADENSFGEALAYARAQKAAGREYCYFEVVALGPTTRYINLWEGCFGEIVGRTYYEPDRLEDLNPDLPAKRTVKAVVVRVNAIDLLNAGVRYATRLKREVAAPIRANQPKASERLSTSR